ncbi:MAG: SPOR domain-containing protein [Treponema sp.]|jgi:DedD protein|nr:SPOR domain-containing protein [Treponema sp.]
MEKKKLLLVAISVGVFLVIVIGASILVFSPRTLPPAMATERPKPLPTGKADETPEPMTPVSVNAVELVKSFDDIQGLQTPPEEKTQDNVFYIYGENPSEVVTVDRSASDTGNRLIVDVPRPKAVAVPDTPRAARPAPAARQTPAPATRSPAPKPKAAASPAPSSRARDNYWVQTGSFSTIARAEAVKETLSAKGITSLVENREVQGKTYFRVRVGPYTSKNEADYWLALIKSIQGFEESLVFKTPAR